MSDELFYKKIEKFLTLLEQFETMEKSGAESQKVIADLLGNMVVHKWMELFGRKTPKEWSAYMNEIQNVQASYNEHKYIDMVKHAEYIRKFFLDVHGTTWESNYVDCLYEEYSPEISMYLEIIEPGIDYGFGDATDYMEELVDYLKDICCYDYEEDGEIYAGMISVMEDSVESIWYELESVLKPFSTISKEEQQEIYTMALLEAAYGAWDERNNYFCFSNPVLKKYLVFSKENPELIKEFFLMEHFYIQQLFEQMGNTCLWEHLIRYSWDDTAIFCSYNYRSESSSTGNGRGNSILLAFYAFLIDWLLQKAAKKFPDAGLYEKKKEESV